MPGTRRVSGPRTSPRCAASRVASITARSRPPASSSLPIRGNRDARGVATCTSARAEGTRGAALHLKTLAQRLLPGGVLVATTILLLVVPPWREAAVGFVPAYPNAAFAAGV